MPLYDIIHEDGTTEEIFVHHRSELEKLPVKIAVSKIHVGGLIPTEEPFAKKILRGFQRQDEKHGKFAHKIPTIKRIWNAA